MNLSFRRDSLILVSGDLIILISSVYIALFFRYFKLPSQELLIEHLLPFTILAVFWVFIFFIAGLYEKHSLILRNRLPYILFNSLVACTFFSVAFFYFVPQFGIEPRTNLFLYVVFASILLFIWRLRGINILRSKETSRAIIIGEGENVNEIVKEINDNPHYSITVVSLVKPSLNESDIASVIEHIRSSNIKIIVANFDDPTLEVLWSKIFSELFSQLRFIDLYRLYEDLFDRAPLNLLRYSWFFENVTLSRRAFYDAGKRLMDVFVASILGIISLIFYPFVILAIKLNDGGPIFIFQERIGAGNKPFKLIKFRTMSFDDSKGANAKNEITKVGKILRSTRIDELPQLWNVFRGTLSLIGPRPELPVLIKEYEKHIPYYGVRHLIKPGLSGWAQIKDYDAPRRGVDVERTRRKLSYDLYYLKNRSLVLDLKIALKTINTLLSKTGT